MFATLPAALLVAGLASGVASAAPGDDITADCLETSQGGSPWVGLDEFDPTWNTINPIPGYEATHLAFDVRNICDVPATLTIYSQNWSVTDDGTATVRGAIDGQKGQQVVIGPGAEATTRIVLQQKALPKNVGTPVEYLLGLPGSETKQGFGITPGWGFQLTEDAPAAVAPGAPTDLTLSGSQVEAGTPVTVSGKAEPGSTVTVSGGGATCTTEADATTGAFSCDLTITSPGDHQVSVTAKNDGGTGPSANAGTVKVTPVGGSGSAGSSSGSLGSLGSLGS
ncbi:Ig-like domain-containing protein [Tomitella biformata]|uniref:Ig-like domain-containing protein n=1 Tax=Tomitella biformata TaxID=630403 RepID=UPI001F21C3D7|nr:Ig-like domain-containing protein [Tomitella biformata]